MHNNIMAAGSRDRPPIHAMGRYAQWQSHFLRYIDTRPNGDALRKCILKGPYTPSTVIIPAVFAIDDSPEVLEQTTVETFLNMSPENKAHYESEKEAIHLLLTRIDDEIYSTVDACKTTHEMWIAIERLQHGESLNIQDVKTNLFWEFGKFTSYDGESMECYYSRFYKMMNEMIRNNLTVDTMQVNVQFLQQLQPEWSRFVTIVKKQHELDTVSYHKLFDVLIQYQKEVNEIRAERIAKNANPLAPVAATQQYPDPYYQAPKSHKSYAPPSKQSSFTRSNASTKYKGKEISKPITPPSESASEEDNDPKKLREIRICKKTWHSLNKNVDTSPRYKNDNLTGQFGNQRTLTIARARETVGSQLRKVFHYKQSKLADTNEEIDEQELEAHYSYMAKIQEVPTADSGTDTKPLKQVQYDAEYNVFTNERYHSKLPESISNRCVVEKVDSNVIPDSSDMCDNDIQNDQNAVECDDERVALANLIANLKLDVDENKEIQKQLKKANTSLAHELKECKSILAKTNAHTELQCLYLHKVKECECLAQKLLKQTETVSKEVYKEPLRNLKAQLQDKNIVISELKKLIEKCIGKYVETKFDKPFVVRQPNTQRIPKPSVLGKLTPLSDSIERKRFSKTKLVPTTNVSEGLSKPITIQILPQTARQAIRNTNVIKLGMYQIDTRKTQTRAPKLPQTSRNTNPRVSTSIRVIHKTNVSRPQLRNTQMKDKVMPNNIQVKFKKTEVEDQHRISSISNKTKSVTAIDQGVGSTSGIRACALRNFDLEDIIKKKSFTQKEEMAPKALLDSKEIALLKRSVGHKEYQMGLLRAELEKVKQEKEGFEFKIAKFDKSAKDLEQLLGSQITDNSKKGLGYSAVPPPHPLILNRPTPLDLSYSGLDEFKEPEFKGYGLENIKKESNVVCENSSNETKKNSDAPIIEEWVSDNEDEVESPVVVKKKTVIPTAAKIEKPVRKLVRYAEMYRSFDHIQYRCPNQQRKRIVSGNNYNKKDNDYYSKTSHSSAHKHIAPRAVLMKTGLKSINTARPVNTVRSVNTGRPFSTARSFNIVRPSYTAHPKSTIHCARPRIYFQNQAQSTIHMPFYKRIALTKRCFNQRFNDVKASACWVWKPKNRVIDHVSKNNITSVTLKRLDYIDAQGRFKQKDQEDEVFGSIKHPLSKDKEVSTAKLTVSTARRKQLVLLKITTASTKSSYYCWFKITAVGEKVNAAESLLVVSTEVNAN
ncbi:hypothetical protein Tco_1320179 [Tanacetum coccineum]